MCWARVLLRIVCEFEPTAVLISVLEKTLVDDFTKVR